ncbi:MAG: rifamycin-inactivating phosphotransferase [Bacteroidota bacterium]
MPPFILDLKHTSKSNLPFVGGKGANLGELMQVESIRVPDGFCVTTQAFEHTLDHIPGIRESIGELAAVKPTDRSRIAELTAKIRTAITTAVIPQEIAGQITDRLSVFDENTDFAIRSSATAEDLPTASFAGQQDSYLNIIGTASVLAHISKCQASLFTERAVIYRMQNGFDHHAVNLSVIVQQMVFPEISGVLFTADPVSGNRNSTMIEASFGLGEALVAGLVDVDQFTVRAGHITDKKIAAKKLAILPALAGGTEHREVAVSRRHDPSLTDTQILQLDQLGRTIATHFGSPQDVEWCLADDVFYVVQSRPITTLFPVPEVNDSENHVYVSVGHQQMMTDAMTPMGLSFFLMITRAPMRTAGGRLFVDISKQLSSTTGRKAVIEGLGKSDPLIKDALLHLFEHSDFIPIAAETDTPTTAFPSTPPIPSPPDPAIVTELIEAQYQSLARLKEEISKFSGTALLDFIAEDLGELKKLLFDPRNMAAILAGMNAAFWLNEKMAEWLGEKNVADVLSQSAEHNITAQMGLDLMDVADTVRPYPDLIHHLSTTTNDDFREGLTRFEGGQEVLDAVNAYLHKYGMRCAGEIDISRTRWSEKPAILLPLILTNLNTFETDEADRKFENGRLQALQKKQELLDRLLSLPDGKEKARETNEMIDTLRAFSGYREFPKYGIVSRYLIYKEALLKEAGQLVASGIIPEENDLWFLSFEELKAVIRTQKADGALVRKRKEDFRIFRKLTPPRVLTSEGESIQGNYKRAGLPVGALAGLAVSSGTVEGRARVILNIEDARIEPGDILVTTFTDPSWTPLFVAVKALVTEVGGLMTHGAVIAREYGLPAVVGVENATRRIKDGDRIRVNGTEGYVELLYV